MGEALNKGLFAGSGGWCFYQVTCVLLKQNCHLFPYRVSFVEVGGTSYRKGSCIVHSFDEDIPIFASVIDIIVTASGDCLFILNPHIGNSYYPHFNAYEVQSETCIYIICRQRDFIDYHPLSLSKSFNSSFSHRTFVCLKHHIFS